MDEASRGRSAERSRIIGEVYATWSMEQAGRFEPDPVLADDPSYSEHADLMSASPEAQAELHRRTAAALEAAGLARKAGSSRLDRTRKETPDDGS